MKLCVASYSHKFLGAERSVFERLTLYVSRRCVMARGHLKGSKGSKGSS